MEVCSNLRDARTARIWRVTRAIVFVVQFLNRDSKRSCRVRQRASRRVRKSEREKDEGEHEEKKNAANCQSASRLREPRIEFG